MSKLVSWIRDLGLILLVVYLISLWQERGLLDDDGSVSIEQQRLVSLDGTVESLTEPGKRTLVYFFAPWCNVCAVSIGNLDGLQSESLNVVRVALDYETRNDVEAFVQRNQVLGQVVLGNNQQKQTFQIPGYPTYYILDENNKVVARSFGYSTNWGMRLKNYLNSSEE